MTSASFNYFKNGLIQFNGLTGGGQGPVVGVTDVRINAGLKEVSAAAAGQVTDSFVAIMDARPTITGTIYDIGQLVTNGVGTSQLAFGSAQTCTSIDVFAVQCQEDGQIVLDSGDANAQVGIDYNVAQGILVLDSISAKQGSPATARFTMHCESTDGTTHPITQTFTADLPSVPVLGAMYTVGLGTVNGTTITSLNSIDYAANFTIEKPASQGYVFNVNTHVVKYNPRLTIGCYDASLWGTYTGLGTALGSSTFALYLTELANKATRVPIATATHIKLAGSASQGMIWPEEVGLTPTSSEIRLHICPIVGSSAVLAISLAAEP